jgi:DNA primase
LAVVNPRTNLGRCFRCEENFNTIDLVMQITSCDFVAAVHFLEEHFPATTSVKA